MDVRRLDVSVDQPVGVGLAERHALQEFHHDVEGSIVGHPKVVECDRVWGPEIGRDLRFAAEPPDRELGRAASPGGDHLGSNQFDGGGAGQHPVGGPIDLTHPAAAEEVAELVAAQFPGFGHLLTQPGHHMGDDGGDADHHGVGVVHQEHVAQRIEPPGSSGPRDQHPDRLHRHRDEAHGEGLCPAYWAPSRRTSAR